jgi:16S rRNA (adenine1518-N6/adenine1519-N6)-dimethyltransferase
VKLSDIRTALAELSMHPSKALGQNFLADTNLARWTVEQLELEKGDHLVEIGPGLGSLTEFAAPACGSMTLIEKDSRLAGRLEAGFAGDERVTVLHGDALEYDVRAVFPRMPAKLLGNLPYYVTSSILFRYGDDPSPFSRMVLTIQREFAERLAAGPRTKAYGALTLLVQRRWEVKYLRTIPASVFMPRPNVESAAILLTPRAPGALTDCDVRRFTRLVKQGFSQRRKQLKKLLGEADWPETARALGVSEMARAEELSLAQWVELANRANPGGDLQSLAQDVHGEMFDVVDENDHVLRQASRHDVHKNHWRHRAVHIFVFNRAGELFLQKRSRWKDAHPSRWDSSAAGHVNAGDDYEETAIREVGEEMGAKVDRVELLARIEANAMTGWEFVHLFRAEHEGPFQLPPAEIETGGFFPVAVIKEWIARRQEDFATGFLECFRRWTDQSAPDPSSAGTGASMI